MHERQRSWRYREGKERTDVTGIGFGKTGCKGRYGRTGVTKGRWTVTERQRLSRARRQVQEDGVNESMWRVRLRGHGEHGDRYGKIGRSWSALGQVWEGRGHGEHGKRDGKVGVTRDSWGHREHDD